jgi:hypothetical protein
VKNPAWQSMSQAYVVGWANLVAAALKDGGILD